MSEKAIYLTDLSCFKRFSQDSFVKVLRHKESKIDLWEWYKSGKFVRKYQNEQSRDIFGKARHVISFIAEGNRYAKFVGVWEVLSTEKKSKKKFRYKMKELPGFESLRGRLIIYWGQGTKSWAQWLHRKGNKEIAELLPVNYVMHFPDYYDVKLSYDQLVTIVNNPEPHREWQRRLVSVSGVYLILDKKTGEQYIGSAYGKGGIWGRWSTYAKNPSGGNKRLKTLLKKHPKRYNHFQFSIIRVLEHSSTKEDVINQESIVKEKLGSRAFGLNGN